MDSSKAEMALSARLSAEDMRKVAPASLRARVRADIAARAPAARPAAWLLPTALVAAGMSLAVAFVLGVSDPTGAEMNGRKSMSAITFATTEPKDLKPLFASELPFRPPVVDAAEIGCPLVAGRVGRVWGERVAVLDYQCSGGHAMVYVTASKAGVAAPEIVARRDNHIVSWRGPRLACRAVSSDVSETRLLRLAAYIQQRAQVG